MSEELPCGYDFDAVPPCRACASTEIKVHVKGGQVVAKCGKCGRYLKNVPRLREDAESQETAEPRYVINYCQMCLRNADSVDRESWLEKHHVIERYAGGSNDPGNLMTVCVQCHRLIHAVRHYAGTNGTRPDDNK